MADFNDFSIETQDEKGVIPENINGTVVTAGTPVTISPSSGKITSLTVYNPRRGPNSNNNNDVLLISVDSSGTKISLPRGEDFSLDTYIDSFEIDANNNNTNFEVVILHD
jgi:hypothetical protein